MNNTYLTYLA